MNRLQPGKVRARRKLLRALTAALALLTATLVAGQGSVSPLDKLRSDSEKAEALIRQGNTGREAQQAQADIVTGLDALIAGLTPEVGIPGTGPAKQGPSKMQVPAPSTGPPRKPAQQSALPLGDWRYGRMQEATPAGEAWAPGLPAAELKSISDAFQTGRLPPRYQSLLREYNKRLAEEPQSPK